VSARAGGQNAPGCGYLRAADADRERVIDALKAAFARGQLTKDQFDAGVGRALTSRTYAELAAVSAGLVAGPVRAQPRGRERAASATPPVLPRQVTRGGSIVQTVRGRQWPRVLVAGLVLVIVGVTLVPSESRPGVILLGVMLVLQAAARGLVILPVSSHITQAPVTHQRRPGCLHSVLTVTCHTKRDNSGTRRSRGGPVTADLVGSAHFAAGSPALLHVEQDRELL